MPALILWSLLLGAIDPAAAVDATVSVVAFDSAGKPVTIPCSIGDRGLTTPATVVVAPGTHRIAWVRDATRVDLGVVVAHPGEFIDVIIELDGHEAAAAVLRDGSDTPQFTDAAAAAVPAPHADETTPMPASAWIALRVHVLGDGGGSADRDGGDRPIVGARVHERGAGERGRTDADGGLRVAVAPGRHTLSVVMPGYAPQIVEVDVVAGEERVLDVALLPVADELDELTVVAPQITGGLAGAVALRREQKQLVEVLGSEQMKKSGDGDAASALRRVTGLTVIGGRYVYVRGLGDRYSSTLVNGASLPSPEPERRVVPLDLFPSSALDALVVQKTWSPDLPGEFGGGSVQLRTRSDPRNGGDKPLLSLQLSTGALLGTTLSMRPQGPDGVFDALAFDDGRRAVPATVAEASRTAPIAEGNALTGGGWSKKELEALGESFSTAWSPRTRLALPALGASVAVGDTVATPWGRLGALGALTWNTDLTHTETERQLTAGSAGNIVVTDDLRIAATERSVSWGGVAGLSLAPAVGHELRAVTLLNRAADDEARIVDGHDDDSDARLRLVRLRYVARQLFVQQLMGTHSLPWAPMSGPLQLDWRLAYALAQRDEPGQRLVRYDENPDGRLLLSARSDGNQILSSALVDHVVDGRVALRLPFLSWAGDAGSLTVGLAASGKSRTVDTRRFKFLLTGPRATDPATRAQGADDIFTPGNIGADGFTLAEATRNTDNHVGGAAVGAGFVAAELPLAPDIVLSGGVRLEASQLRVTTFELFNAAAAPVVADLVNVDVLPAIAVAWNAWDDLTFKAAASRTIVRPELRELSPALYTDVAGSRARYGNPGLQSTGIVHLDARLEWAWSPQDGLSVAAFAKHFDKPIESVVSAGADQALTAANVDAAVNAGLEVEGRAGFGRLVPGLAMLPVLDGLWFGGNGALIASRVFIGPAQRGTLSSTERPLEGQSPWVMNGQLGFDDDARGTSLVLLYNVFGPRIVEVGALGLPDAVEEPFHQLDLVLRQRLAGGFSLGVKASNLLDPVATRTVGGRTVDRVVRGRFVAASLSWTW